MDRIDARPLQKRLSVASVEEFKDESLDPRVQVCEHNIIAFDKHLNRITDSVLMTVALVDLHSSNTSHSRILWGVYIQFFGGILLSCFLPFGAPYS